MVKQISRKPTRKPTSPNRTMYFLNVALTCVGSFPVTRASSQHLEAVQWRESHPLMDEPTRSYCLIDCRFSYIVSSAVNFLVLTFMTATTEMVSTATSFHPTRHKWVFSVFCPLHIYTRIGLITLVKVNSNTGKILPLPTVWLHGVGTADGRLDIREKVTSLIGESIVSIFNWSFHLKCQTQTNWNGLTVHLKSATQTTILGKVLTNVSNQAYRKYGEVPTSRSSSSCVNLRCFCWERTKKR